MSSKSRSAFEGSRRGDGELADELLDEDGGEAMVVEERQDVPAPRAETRTTFAKSRDLTTLSVGAPCLVWQLFARAPGV